MLFADYSPFDSEPIIAVVTLGDKSTPVWQQSKWKTGRYQEFVRKNGCGHCCAAMALNLYGIKIDPHGEFALCRELWGAPGVHQGNYQTVAGITKILRHYGVAAQYFGVPSRRSAAEHIKKVLQEGKQVIIWTPGKATFADNPFSFGEHYIMAVGFTKDGQILVANSSAKCAPTGVQMVELSIIEQALYLDTTPDDKTWGEGACHEKCAGYVVVG